MSVVYGNVNSMKSLSVIKCLAIGTLMGTLGGIVIILLSTYP
jgi:hypothetical protein